MFTLHCRESHRKVVTAVKVILLAEFLAKLSLFMLLPYLSIFIVSFVRDGQLSTVAIGAALVIVVFSLTHSGVASMLSKVKSINLAVYLSFIGSLMMAIVLFLFSYIELVPQLYSLLALAGVAVALLHGGWHAIYTGYFACRKDSVWSILDVSMWFVVALGIVLGGMVIEIYSFQTFFVTISLLNVVGALLLFFIKNRLPN